jgi:hypothetical protein
MEEQKESARDTQKTNGDLIAMWETGVNTKAIAATCLSI